MANTTGNDRLLITPWTNDPVLRIPAETPSTSTIFYAAQAVMRDVAGNMIQCDDTQKGEFAGVLADFIRTQVDPVDVVQYAGVYGDKIFDVTQPQMIMALIASATASDVGKNVYWLYNNQVAYTGLTYWNYAGKVLWVKDSTHVLIRPPWLVQFPVSCAKSFNANSTGGSVATTQLTRFDVGRVIQFASTVSQTAYLPLSTTLGNGDSIGFIQIGSSSQVLTVAPYPSSSDLINTTTAWGASSYALPTTRGSRVIFMTDGNGNWTQVG